MISAGRPPVSSLMILSQPFSSSNFSPGQTVSGVEMPDQWGPVDVSHRVTMTDGPGLDLVRQGMSGGPLGVKLGGVDLGRVAFQEVAPGGGAPCGL